MNGARCACGGKPRRNVGPCDRCYHRQYRAAHREEIRARAKDYYHLTRDARLESQRKYRAKHAEKLAAARAEKRKRTPAEQRQARSEAQRRYRSRHREAYAAREAARRVALRQIPEQKLVRVGLRGWGVRVPIRIEDSP